MSNMTWAIHSNPGLEILDRIAVAMRLGCDPRLETTEMTMKVYDCEWNQNLLYVRVCPYTGQIDLTEWNREGHRIFEISWTNEGEILREIHN